MNISNEQMNYITNVEAGSGLIKYGGALVSINRFPKNPKLCQLMTTRPGEGRFAGQSWLEERRGYPEIKTKRKSQPVLNTAQQQMRRGFVRARQGTAVHRQSERSESPSNYAEEKVSRTAEDTVRCHRVPDVRPYVRHVTAPEIHSVRGKRRSAGSRTGGFPNRREARSKAAHDASHPHTGACNGQFRTNPACLPRRAARKAAAQDIIGRKKQQKEEELGFEGVPPLLLPTGGSRSGKPLYFKSV